MISEVKQYAEEQGSDTYSWARGSSGASFSIFAWKTLRGGRINGDEAKGHTKKEDILYIY